jgi:hypothetical protein
MKQVFFLFSAVLLAGATGCAASQGGPLPAHYPAHWEVVELAEGVELRVRQDASPGAKKTAEQVVVQYESGYLNAH